MTSRPLLPVVAFAVLLAGCGGSSSVAPAKALPTSSAGTSTGSSAAPGPGGSAAASTSGAAAAKLGAAPGSSAAAAASSTGAVSHNGAAAPSSTAPGTYTFDNTGTVTAGTQRDASGTSTLTVDPPASGQQHSLLSSDQGRTEQDVVVRTNGTYLARLAITNPAFSKEFRPASPVLLVPDPATAGRSWSWTAVSTDGKTTAAVTAKVARRETLTIGGARTQTVVVASTLRLTGDITYTGQMETWYDPAHRLTAKEHTKGSGTVSGLQFTTDITSVLRSLSPS
ncbi:MAG: hypothetical protein JWP11_2757 [Frankiales bacterium]|nr:hypothetical protein [Frankiales bacterium]